MISIRRGFTKRHRLKKARDYQFVFASPYSLSDRNITVLARYNGRGHPRLGLIISRKCTKSAVIRNRIKRVIRESFRQHMAGLPPCDIIVLARRGAVFCSNGTLHDALAQRWAELARWKG